MSQRDFAQRVAKLRSFRVMDFMEAAALRQQSGRDIIHMEVGEPTFSLPPKVKEAALEAVNRESNGYTPSLGTTALRQAIARFTNERYGTDICPDRVVVTTGSSAGLGLVCDLLLNPGDSLLLSDPGYPCNAQFIHRCGATPIRIPVDAHQHFQLTATDIEQYWLPSTAGALVASPSNPTGDVLDRQSLTDLHRSVSQRNGVLIVDEIYHGLVYEPDSTCSILNLTDDAYIINSFSKYFAMPGWRLGWLVAPERAIEPLRTMIQNFYISPPTIAQAAALAAFHPDSLELYEERKIELKARRDYLGPALVDLGFDIHHIPGGAFYLYANIDKLAEDSEAFCWQMLEAADVAITPGTDFGDHLSNRHVRFSYTEPLPRLQEAVARIKKVLKR